MDLNFSFDLYELDINRDGYETKSPQISSSIELVENNMNTLYNNKSINKIEFQDEPPFPCDNTLSKSDDKINDNNKRELEEIGKSKGKKSESAKKIKQQKDKEREIHIISPKPTIDQKIIAECMFIDRIKINEKVFKVIDQSKKNCLYWRSIKDLLSKDLPYLIIFLGLKQMFMLFNKDSLFLEIMKDEHKKILLEDYNKLCEKDNKVIPSDNLNSENIKKIKEKYKGENDIKRNPYKKRMNTIEKALNKYGLKSCSMIPKVKNHDLLKSHIMFSENKEHLSISECGELIFNRNYHLLWEMPIQEKESHKLLSSLNFFPFPSLGTSPTKNDLSFAPNNNNDNINNNFNSISNNNNNNNNNNYDYDYNYNYDCNYTYYNNNKNTNKINLQDSFYENNNKDSISSIKGGSNTVRTSSDLKTNDISSYLFCYKEEKQKGTVTLSVLIEKVTLLEIDFYSSFFQAKCQVAINGSSPKIQVENFEPSFEVNVLPHSCYFENQFLHFVFSTSSNSIYHLPIYDYCSYIYPAKKDLLELRFSSSFKQNNDLKSFPIPHFVDFSNENSSHNDSFLDNVSSQNQNLTNSYGNEIISFQNNESPIFSTPLNSETFNFGILSNFSGNNSFQFSSED